MLEDRIRRRVLKFHITHVPSFAARCLLEHHRQNESLKLQRNTADVSIRTVTVEFRIVGQESVRFFVLVQFITVLNAK